MKPRSTARSLAEIVLSAAKAFWAKEAASPTWVMRYILDGDDTILNNAIALIHWHDRAALNQEARHAQLILAAVMRISMRWFGFAISARTQERAGGWSGSIQSFQAAFIPS